METAVEMREARHPPGNQSTGAELAVTLLMFPL
jgi:hypothetical protein